MATPTTPEAIAIAEKLLAEALARGDVPLPFQNGALSLINTKRTDRSEQVRWFAALKEPAP